MVKKGKHNAGFQDRNISRGLQKHEFHAGGQEDEYHAAGSITAYQMAGRVLWNQDVCYARQKAAADNVRGNSSGFLGDDAA